MDASAVSHIAFCVSDIEQSLSFYRDALGMEVILDQVQDTTRGGLPHVYHHARQTRRTVHLAFSDSPLHLVMTSHPGDSADGTPIKLDQVGISHFLLQRARCPGAVQRVGVQGRAAGRPPGRLDQRPGSHGQLLRLRPGRHPGPVRRRRGRLDTAAFPVIPAKSLPRCRTGQESRERGMVRQAYHPAFAECRL